ncbi:DUF2378 family protein [Archangium primigenium]|uniref:DUF2378 family protein n=1 Tax=[Archangium] primigenium TaxID=2792470 RepID=UPI0019598568|nr:DUF2378 family protein [Archangium primigenium]MBM7117811.1 DUF2378 family protein [Archangium primigenium]
MTGPREPVVFSTMVEALIKLVGGRERFDSEKRKWLKAIGIDLDQPLLVAYSLPTWFGFVRVCAELLHPGLDPARAHYRVGFAFVAAYGRTTMGRAVFMMMRMLGFEHSLSRINKGLNSGINFLSARTRFLEDGSLEMTFEVLPEFHAALGPTSGIDPHFMNGNMDAMMALVDAPFQPGKLQHWEPHSQRAVFVMERKVPLPRASNS